MGDSSCVIRHPGIRSVFIFESALVLSHSPLRGKGEGGGALLTSVVISPPSRLASLADPRVAARGQALPLKGGGLPEAISRRPFLLISQATFRFGNCNPPLKTEAASRHEAGYRPSGIRLQLTSLPAGIDAPGRHRRGIAIDPFPEPTDATAARCARAPIRPLSG
jgi:hypothetical protein